MKKLLAVCLIFPWNAGADPTQLHFVVYYPQVPPYIFTNLDSNQVEGVVPSLMNEFFKQQHIQYDYVIDNRKGAEMRLYKGDVDAMLLAKTWAQQPQKLIFSKPILVHRDFLYSTKPFDEKIADEQWLKGARICARQYYVYEALEPFFAKDTTRVDSSSEHAQLRMMMSNRCDYAYMNEHVAHWMQLNQFPKMKLYQSPHSFGEVGLTIAFHPRWAYLMPALNQYLTDQQSNGQLQEIIKSELQRKSRFTPALDEN